MNRKHNKKKIIIYSHDTLGLGNISRMLAIAKAMVQSDPNRSLLILSGSPMLHAFRIPPQIDYVKLPCLTRTMAGHYEAKFLDLGLEDISRLRSNLIQSAIQDFDPDLILVDKKPFGVCDELSTALTQLQRSQHRAKLVLLLRDILDTPESTMRVWQKNGYHQAIQDFYDQVLVVGCPEVFDLRNEYNFPKASYDKVRFCGYLAREPGLTPRQKMRRQYGIGNDRLVLVTPGGGEDGYQLVKSYLEGLRAQPLQQTKSLIICGPEMIESQRQHIAHLVQKIPHVIMQSFTDDMMSCMAAADLVICMGGYNTVCELLTLEKPAILVPRTEPVQEQWLRADRMAHLGLVQVIHPRTISPTRLMTSVNEELAKLNATDHDRYQINMQGLTNVCSAVDLLMDGRATAFVPKAKFKIIDSTHSKNAVYRFGTI